MMPKKLVINLFDLGIIIFVIIFATTVLVGKFLPKTNNSSKIYVKISVTTDKKSILEQAKLQKEVYFSSQNNLVNVVSVDGNEENLTITLLGEGRITDKAYFLSNQRISVGQKAEIHGTYYAQGVITEVTYANQ